VFKTSFDEESTKKKLKNPPVGVAPTEWYELAAYVESRSDTLFVNCEALGP
jgi:hypothetical protein